MSSETVFYYYTLLIFPSSLVTTYTINALTSSQILLGIIAQKEIEIILKGDGVDGELE